MIVNLPANLIALISLQYSHENMAKLGAVSKFLLIYLILWEHLCASNSQQKRVTTLKQLYRETGLNNENANRALVDLEKLRLLRWQGGRLCLNQQALTDFIGRYFDPQEGNLAKWAMLTNLCQFFFNIGRRQRTVGRMDYLDKLLILSLAVAADEYGQLREFDFRAWSKELNIEQKALVRRLEGLRIANGFVLGFSEGLALGEGINHKTSWVILNPSHPWLFRYMKFYGFCAMGDHVSMLQKRSAQEIESTDFCVVSWFLEETGFSRFRDDLSFNRYYCHLANYVDSLKRIEEVKKTMSQAVEQDGQPENGRSNDGSGNQTPPANAVTPDQVVFNEVPQWGKSIKQLEWRVSKFERNIFRICVTLAQEVLRDMPLNERGLAPSSIGEALASHPLFDQWKYRELAVDEKLTPENTRQLFLNLLHGGVHWMISKMKPIILTALASHPDKGVANGDISARFVHFATPNMGSGSNKNRLKEHQLALVVFFGISGSQYDNVFVQQTPDDKILGGLPHGPWRFVSKGRDIRIRPYYECSLNASAAMINELRMISPSEKQRRRKDQQQFGDEASVRSWVDYLHSQSLRFQGE